MNTSVNVITSSCRFISIVATSFLALGVFATSPSAGLLTSDETTPGQLTNYDDQVTSLLVARAKQASTTLSRAGFIPVESFPEPSVMLQGKSIQPSGYVKSAVCNYEFRLGALSAIQRADLFEDKGPDSLILHHLTNEVLTLKTNDAANRALDLLRQLSFDADAIHKAYRIQVTDDLMEAYPVRDGGSNFPKELHFFGELISRRHIKIKVEFTPIDTNALAHSRQSGDMRIEFLATTGELLAARFAYPDALAKLGIRAPDRITLEETSDFAPPTYFLASQKLGLPAGNISSNDASALLDATWRELQQKLGGHQPHCYLICDDMNTPEVIAPEMNRLVQGTPWAGVSHYWRNDLPFDPVQMDRLARVQRGIGILAICGKIQTQLESVSGLDAIPIPGNDKQGQELSARQREQFLPKTEQLLKEMPLSNNVSDHALFLFQPNGDYSARVVFGELLSRLKGKAEVFDCMGPRPYGGGGEGADYFNGNVLTNSMIVLGISGSLPLRMDPASWLRQRPTQRPISWEVTQPIGDFAFSFGPHPMQELFNYLGRDGTRFLQEAERVETFRIKSNSPDDWSVAGKPDIEGHQIVTRGKTWGRDFAQQLASSLLNEKDVFGGISGCIWAPRHAFRLWRGKESAIMLICFDCNEVEIRFYDAAGKQIHATTLDFGENRNALLQLTQKAFPSDSELKMQPQY